MAADGRRRRRLADPTRTAGDDDVLGREEPPDRRGHLGSGGGSSVPELLAQGLGHLVGRAEAMRGG